MKYLAACLFVIVLGVALVPFGVHAQTNIAVTCDKSCDSYTDYNQPSPKIEVSIPIPGVTESVQCYDNKDALVKTCRTMNTATDFGDYLAKFYTFFVGIVGILATVMVLYGAIRWILAAGNQSRISGAKTVITSAIIGVVIAFTSYLLLYLLNPRLISYDHLATTMGLVKPGQISSANEIFCQNLIPQSATGGSGAVGPGAPSGVKGKVLKTGDECYVTKYCSPAGEFFIENAVCGDAVEITSSPNNAVAKQNCMGNLCPKGTCYQDIGRCVSGLLAGSIEWEGSADVKAMTLVGICNDGSRVSDNGGWLTGGSIFGTDRLSREVTGKFYAYGNASDPIDYAVLKGLDQCGLHEKFAGYALIIEVNDDSVFNMPLVTSNDNYAVGKDGKSISTLDPKDIEPKDWKDARGRLFKLSDFEEVDPAMNVGIRTNPIRFNLTITRDQFPAR